MIKNMSSTTKMLVILAISLAVNAGLFGRYIMMEREDPRVMERAKLIKQLRRDMKKMPSMEVSIERVVQDYEDNALRAQREYGDHVLTVTGAVVRHVHKHPFHGGVYLSLYRESDPYALADVHCYLIDEEDAMRVRKGDMVDVRGVPVKVIQKSLMLEICELKE